MGALLAESEPFSVDIGDERLAQIFEFEGKRSLSLQQEVDRTALSVQERVLQPDFLTRVSGVDFHGKFMLEIGFRAKDWPSPGHAAHEGIDFEQAFTPDGTGSEINKTCLVKIIRLVGSRIVAFRMPEVDYEFSFSPADRI